MWLIRSATNEANPQKSRYAPHCVASTRESEGFQESTLIVLTVLRFQLISPISWTDSEPMRPRDNVFQSCQPGTFRNAANSNKCDQCRPGYFQADSDSTKCDLCFGDTYADQFGAPNCTKCAANTQRKTAEPGESGLADSALVCECIPGAHLPLTYESEVRHSCDTSYVAGSYSPNGKRGEVRTFDRIA